MARRRTEVQALVDQIQAVIDQAIWIRDHGGNLAGYVERYGSKDDPEHYGDGGEAIYAADLAEYERRLRHR